MKKLFLLFTFNFMLLTNYAQDYQKIDSLKNILKTLPEINGTYTDTNRMKVCLNLGNVYEISQNDSALYWYEIVADSIIDFQNLLQYKRKASLKASAFFMSGRVNYLNNNYSQATKNCMVSLKMYEKLGYKSELSECLRYLGVIESEQGNYIEAISYLERSLKIDEVIGDKDGIATCLINLGNIVANQGYYAKAITYFEQSLKIFKEINNEIGISGCLTNLGLVTCYQGNYNEANKYYNQSLKIDEDLGDKKGIAICLINLGLVADKQQNYNEAIAYYEKSMNIVSELDDKRLISICLIGLGNQALGLRDYTLAKTYFTRSLKINENLGEKLGIADCLTNLGICETNQGNYFEAINYYKRSVNLKEKLGDKANLATDYAVLANFITRIQHIPEALNLFLKSHKNTLWLLQDNFAIMSENDKSLYLDNTKNIFNYLHEFNLKYPAFSDSISNICYNNELLLKGLLLNSSAGLMDAVYNSPNAEIKNTYFLLKQYRDNIAGLQGTDEPDKDSLIADLEQKANEQERKLARLSTNFANTQKIFNYQWQYVQKGLKENEAALELVKINHSLTRPDTCTNDSFSYAALILKPGMEHPEMIPLCDEISLNKIVGTIGWSDPTLVKMIYQKGSRKGLRLYEKIWQPLEPYLKDVKTIYIAPTGLLHQIAFHAIPCPDSSLMSDRFNINMVSSTRILADSAVQEPLFASQNNNVAIFGRHTI